MRNSWSMNIQEIIQELAAIKEEHGNLPVVVCNNKNIDEFDPIITVTFIGSKAIRIELIDKNCL